MPRVKIGDLYLDKKIYDHVEELSMQAHLTIKETIECLLYQNVEEAVEQTQKAREEAEGGV